MAKFTTDKIIVIFTVVSAALLQLIDTSIVNVALNDMMGNLGATFEEIGWVITGYAVSNVIMITLSGWMSAKFGRKYYFAGSIILFTIPAIITRQRISKFCAELKAKASASALFGLIFRN